MKGLAVVDPGFATVGMSGRAARKHYGTGSRKPFDKSIHSRAQMSVHASCHHFEYE